ncbi:MAG: DUF302 domain-containing protein [Pseudomonadota bacterium]
MIPRMIIALLTLTSLVGCAHQVRPAQTNGVLMQRSAHSVDRTVAQLEQILSAKGFTVFAIVRHANGAASVGQTLRPTTVVVFGNPAVGTPLMRCAQSVALDLPQKMLIYEDDDGSVWLAYNDPAYLFDRHTISGCDAWLAKIDSALSGIASAATTRLPAP